MTAVLDDILDDALLSVEHESDITTADMLKILILIADCTPKETFEKVSTISEEYMETSQFETNSITFKIGGRKTQPVVLP